MPEITMNYTNNNEPVAIYINNKFEGIGLLTKAVVDVSPTINAKIEEAKSKSQNVTVEIE
jgi:hypothetical protein